MTDSVLPIRSKPASVFITPFSEESLGSVNRTIIASGPATAVYIAAQRALFFPFTLFRQETVYRFFWVNGTTASTDYIQVGVYDRSGNAIKLGTGGSPNYGTLAATASVCQFDNVADFVLSPGGYFMAIWCSGVTTHLMRTAPTARFLRAAGTFQQSSLTTGLPTTATFAAQASAYMPMFGLALRASP